MLDLNPRKLKFLPQNLTINTWDDLKPYADQLTEQKISSIEEYKQWLSSWYELQLVVAEEYHWCYIRQTQNTEDKEAEKRYNNFLNVINNNVSVLNNTLQKKALASEFANQFDQQGFSLLKKRWKASNDIFVKENVDLQAQVDVKAADYDKIRGPMKVNLDGEEFTFQQALRRLEWQDRNKREEAWFAVKNKMYEGKDAYDQVITELVPLRTQIALNAGFKNYRDYKFQELQRFDYGPKEALAFHEAIAKEIVPVLRKIYKKRADEMGLEKLRPWDLECDPHGREGLKAFENAADFEEKLYASAKAIDNDFEQTIARMRAMKMFDLASRLNKSPGAYNASMPISKTSFMYGNVTGSVHDVSTGFHEGGHAFHGHLSSEAPLKENEISLMANEDYPMEMAELASMSMELISHDQWFRFFPNQEDADRAKYDHISNIVDILVLVAKMDSFQHELYEKPEMTSEERHDIFDKIQSRYDTGMVDWNGLEKYRNTQWHNQRHIFNTPFYMIEYGFAQTGAIGVWKNYKENSVTALRQYKNALSLGYKVPLPKLYEAAGVPFDFSANRLGELMPFLNSELDKLTENKKGFSPS